MFFASHLLAISASPSFLAQVHQFNVFLPIVQLPVLSTHALTGADAVGEALGEALGEAVGEALGEAVG
jgi:hypothetical protein